MPGRPSPFEEIFVIDPCYHIDDPTAILSPGLVLFRELLEANIDRMISIAKSPGRLRPHCKTHKMADVIRVELTKGITKHKCATLAEAEMLAGAGVKDIFLAYNLVGPNIPRAVAFVRKFPEATFSVTADHEGPIAALGALMTAARSTIDVLLDVDVGQHRTGIPPGPAAKALYQRIATTIGLRPGGLHIYDGHHHQTSATERRAAVDAQWQKVLAFRDDLLRDGLPVPRLIAGGTPTFPIYADKDDPAIELSPGTCVLNDAGYGTIFPDLQFVPAALLLTRVVSRPADDRMTVDLGYKAIASDPPAGKRVMFPDLPDAVAVLHNEEHLVLETSRARDFQPGDVLLAIPRHICPTSALHKEAYVIADGRLVDRWPVTARDRQLTI
jgi:D-serine deaminase-like pyridoxal phosphate-dependent protein